MQKIKKLFLFFFGFSLYKTTFLSQMPSGFIKKCTTIGGNRLNDNCHPHYKQQQQQQQRCLHGFCLHLPASSIGNKVADVGTKFSPKLSVRSKSKSFRSDCFQPELDDLLKELRECILDGNTVIEELEQFKQSDGNNLHKKLPLDCAAVDQTDGEIEEQKEGGGTAATEKVEQFVKMVKRQFELGKRIEKLVPCLFEELCASSVLLDDADANEHFRVEQQLSKSFAKVLEIGVRYDTLKASTPALQNAFSLFRRISALNGTVKGRFHLLFAHQSDQISLFLARPIPLLCSLVNGAERFIGRWHQSSRSLAMSHLTGALLVIYKVLKHMVERINALSGASSAAAVHQQQPMKTVPFLHSMVGVLLLFDHVDSVGVFSPHSPFDIVNFVGLTIQSAGEAEGCQLLATLRFFSKSFNSSNTAASMRSLLLGRGETVHK